MSRGVACPEVWQYVHMFCTSRCINGTRTKYFAAFTVFVSTSCFTLAVPMREVSCVGYTARA